VLPGPCLRDVVLFELPSPSLGARLMEHVGSERFAWKPSEQELQVVGVVLTSDDLDLAHLLRNVQSWLALQGLASIRFELDGRSYALESRALARAAG
jgi:hypothetical protein